MPGEIFLEEIREQGTALRRFLERRNEIEALAIKLARRNPRLVRMAGHGSSDNVGTFGVYAFGLLAGWTAIRNSISLLAYFDAPLDLSNSIVLALSQSGATPDVVHYAERAKRHGALVVAVTNEASSPLAIVADDVVLIDAGEERAVPATKTYSNQIAAIALLAAAVAGRAREFVGALEEVSRLVDDTVEATLAVVQPVAAALADVERMFVFARGPEFATAREIELKLTETCQMVVEALTATDFAHGPVAAVGARMPVWAIATRDASLPAVRAAADESVAAGGTLIVSGSAADLLEGASYRLPCPAAPLPILSPLLSILPGQVFAWALADAKGLDADHPSHLRKVTLAP